MKSRLRYRSDNPKIALTVVTATVLLSAGLLLFDPPLSDAVPPTVNISDNDGRSIDPVIASSGSNVYIAWVDDTSGNDDIVFIKSEDGGNIFDAQTTFDDSGGVSNSPSIAASDSNVYIAWRVDTEIYFSSSADSGTTFSTPVNLSSNPTSSNNPRVASSGSNVYIAWVDGSTTTADVYVVASNNSGAVFSGQVILDDSGGRSADPRISAEGSSVYVTWKNLISSNNEVYFSSSADSGATFSTVNLSSTAGASTTPTVATSGENVHVAWAESTAFESAILIASSADGGATFGSPESLSVDDLPAGLPSIAVSGTGEVYVTWEVFVDLENDIKDVYFSSSADSGGTFTTPVNLSSNAGQSLAPSVVVSGVGIHVVWLDNFIDSVNNEVLATFSNDGGQNFVAPINLSNSPGNTFKPGLAVVEGQDAVVVMYEVPDESTPAEIHFQSDIDFAQAVISISEVSSASPRWDIDTVAVSGILSNAEDGDTVTIDWGDGTITSGLNHSGSEWGPFSHPYSSDSIASNPVQIVAHLVDSLDSVRASSAAESIAVQPHSTALELDFIASVDPGSNVTISGTLTDADAFTPITGALITLNGTGTIELPDADGLATGDDGKFSITGPAPNSTSDDWTVQAHFAGNQTYTQSDSPVEVYATQSVDAVEYLVFSGQNVSVDLTNLSFNATITFDDVLEDGSIFVSECVTPPSGRYASMGICADISSSLLLAEDTDFVLTVKFADTIAAVEGVEDDIDMFHLIGSGQVVDITQSRDLSTLTVSGVASTFSKFIVAKAEHVTEPEGAFREQLYVSSEPDNIVHFRNITNTGESAANITLNKDRYRIGETATLTIADPEANVNPSETDIVSAGIVSETSDEKDPNGILIVLHETDPNSSVFSGTFTLTSEASSGSSLEAKNGDELTVAYNLPGRAKIVIDGVVESGLIQVTDYLVPQDADFRPFSGAIKVELVDAQLAPGARVTVTLSYANTELAGNNPEFLRVVQETSDGVWKDITLRDAGGNITGVDTDAKTITGETGSVGSFSVGGDVGVPGGAGGGLARPGSGLVVDFVASVISSSRSSGGGGGSGGTTGFMTTQVSEMSDSDTKFVVGVNSTVAIEFQDVTASGSVYLKEVKISDLPSGSFVSSTLTQGTVDLQGSEAQTVGKIFDITYSSGFGFEPPILVTLPYDESLVNASGLSEQDVRLLHYTGGKWEDTTLFINTTANTVSGKLDALSPVVAAVFSDGTFGAAYYDENPLTKVSDVSAITEDPTRIIVELRNTQRVEQRLTVLAQVLDADGVVMAIGWTSGTISGAQSGTYEVDLGTLELSAPGGYTIQVFVIDDIESPSPEMLAPQVRIGPERSR